MQVELTAEQSQRLGAALVNIQRCGGKHGALSIWLPQQEGPGRWLTAALGPSGRWLEEAEGPTWLEAIISLEQVYLQKEGLAACATAPEETAARDAEAGREDNT